MKGKNLVNVVQSLTQEEYEFVLRTLSGSPKHGRYACIFSAIREFGTVKRSTLAKHCKLSERAVREITPLLGKELTFWLGVYERDQPIELEMALSTAYKLVFRIQNGAARKILQELYNEATEFERFDILMEVWKLAEIMTETPEIQGISKDAVIRLQLNVSQYQDLRNKAEYLQQLSKTQQLEALELLESSELLATEDAAMSASAKAHYYWIWTRIHFIKNNFAGVVTTQEKLVSLLDQKKWLDRYDGFFFAKEHHTLISALAAENNTTEAYHMLFKVGNLQPNYPLTESFKWNQIYPLKLAMAIHDGDWDRAKECTDEIELLVKNEAIPLSTKFVTQSLYWCAYYHFIVSDIVQAKKNVSRLSSAFYPSDFNPKIAPMIRVLSAFLAFEEKETDELILIDKNFRSTNLFDAAGYYRFVLNALKRISRLTEPDEILVELTTAKARFEEILQEPNSADANNRFDFSKWLDSKLTGHPMAEQFYHQASREAGKDMSIGKTAT